MQTLAVSRYAVKLAARPVGHSDRPEVAAPAAMVGVVQRFARGEALFSECDEATSALEMLSGVVRISKMLPDGRRQIIAFVSDGHFFGIPSRGSWSYSAEAVTDATVSRLRRAVFDNEMATNRAFVDRVLRSTAAELLMAQEELVLLGRKSAMERVATFLLRMVELQDGSMKIKLPITRADIADHLGLTIETVSRSLTRLRQEGVIALPHPSSVEVIDRDILEDLSEGELRPAC